MDRGVALITGAGTGIGAACATLLSSQGFSVGIHYNRSQATAAELSSRLPNSFLIQADISSIDGVEDIFTQISSRKETLSVLVNNAGIVRDGLLFSSKPEEFEEIINTNLRSSWYLTKRMAKVMMRQKKGRIINISSVIGHTGNAGQSLYGMTKAAIDNFTKSAAAELGPYGILVNSVAPGFIDTDMTKDLPDQYKETLLSRIPLGRMGTPEEIADVVSFLATGASYCSGSVFHVNGGMYGG